ncbi:complement C1q tumor necrosis factor-related protein 3-like [Mya arenaria]|uniref:complement C1q tumor necrosis factor-related protein 3-like n=1 Tax=Mya arenaria TaxID=6604 RepID=UPI0022E43492|nr:complement C1q tumor necrosis factor-related protein 3-like [Mya arenaria]
MKTKPPSAIKLMKDWTLSGEKKAQLRELISEMSTNHTVYERQHSSKVEEFLSSARASLDEAIQLTKGKETPFVLFHASNPKDISPATGDTIVFLDIQTNEGLGYDDVTGKFTAPVSGLYMFFMQVCVYDKVYVNLQLVKEANVLIGSTYYHTQGGPCSSAQVVTRLVESESVWVYCPIGRDSDQLFQNQFRWTSFGGALVHK